MSDFFERMQSESKLPATHENYDRRSKAFIAWLKRKYPECWDEDSKFQLSRVTTPMVCEYIAVTSQKADGTLLAPSTPESNHSAIVDMYRTARLRLPDGLNVEWLQFIKGFKNRTADNIAAGIQATAGSDKLTFEQYRMLSGLAVASKTFYAHGFLVLAWNLMSRARSTGNVKFEHLRWDNDHLIVVVPKHKGDRAGDKLPTEKSVYANPVYPEICPFLVLGIVLLSREDNGKIESVLLGSKSEININN